MTEEKIPFAECKVLVVGSGSIGRRHMANLRQLGVVDLAAADPDAERLQPVVNDLQVEAFSDLESSLRDFKPKVVFICTPPSLHVEQALAALRSGADVFIEKPVSHTLEGLAALKDEAARLSRVVQVGYNLRFHPGIQMLKRLVDDGVAGRIEYLRAEVAQYLPDWRPWQDYRQSYTAKRSLGGGILLDASHEVDYVLWLLGPPRHLTCMAGRVSELDVEVEDCATILLRLHSGAQADVHMDFVQRAPARSCVISGNRARLEWDFTRNEVKIFRPGSPPETFSYEFETNQMYVSEVMEFFTHVQTRQSTNQSLHDSETTLSVALAAQKAAYERRWFSFEA